MSFTPSADAQATAALAGSNQASLASPLTALQASITAGNLAPAALFDALLSALGFQAESNNALGTHNNGGSSSYADIPGASFTFVAPIAKTYVVHADFSPYFSAGTSPTGYVRLVVNGDNGPDMVLQVLTGNTNFLALHLMHAAVCALGNNTVKLQWKTSSGTMAVESPSVANFIVGGG